MINLLPIFSFGTQEEDLVVLDVGAGRFVIDRRASVIVVNRPPAAHDGKIKVGPLIRDCFEQLKPGGLLYLRVDNWFWSNRLTSRIIRKVVWLMGREAPPRADALAKSYRSVEKILRHSGFDRIRCFALLPHGESPTHLIPLDRQNVIDFFLLNVPWSRSAGNWVKKIVFRLAARFGLLSFFVPSFCVVAEKVAL